MSTPEQPAAGGLHPTTPPPTTPPPTASPPTAPPPDTSLPTTMRAVVQREYGLDPHAVLRVGTLPVPTLGPDEVLVRVTAAGVDRGTLHLMEGRPYLVRPAIGLRHPRHPVPGLDLTGTVAQVGTEVEGFAPGDRVFGAGRGSLAEYCAAKAAKLAHVPADLGLETAAAVAISGWTALQAVRDKARVGAGDRVLVLGASGGVGSYAVQVAKAAGAVVTAVASGPKLDFVAALGADEVVDYTTTDPCAEPGRYDVILDINGCRRLRTLRRALTPKGRLVVVGGEGAGLLLGGTDRMLRAQLWSPFVRQSLMGFVSSENAEDLVALRDLIEAGQVTPAVDRILPLDDAAEALRLLTAGEVRGKVVVSI